MTNLVANLDDSATRRFALLFGLWLAAYAAIVLAWAANNDWPVELWTPLAFVPISLIAAKKLSLRNGFQLAPHDRLSHWELLIAFLLLAVGIAGGLMLLLAVGWLNLGIVCLRPKRLPGDCGEWLKLPLLFACCLPVWTDLSGSRQDWLVYFGVSSSAGPAAMVTFQIASRVALVLLAWWTRGAAFWICLVALPVLVAGLRFVAAPFQFALNDLALDFAVWLVAALLLSGLGLALNRVLDARPNFRASWQRATSRALARPPEPWLAALLILLQQSSLVETWRAGVKPSFDVVGAGLLVAALVLLRRRTSPGPMSLNSRVALAAALFVLLAAEWTDLNPLRHFSLGLLVVAAASWGRAWSWAVMITALVAWTATLPVTVLLLKRASLPEATVDTLRIVALITALAALVCSAMQPRQTSRPKIYHDDGWQPVKRFAFTLLCLLLGFQTISAFWPEAEPELPSNAGKSDPSLFPAASRLLASVPGVLSWSVEPMKPPVELTVSRPADAPIQLNAPELIFCNAGWRITERRLIPHGNGQAVALTLARGKEAAGAVFWFQNDDRAFVHYLRARQILWSGWNLNRRDLREVLLFSEGAAGPEPLIRLAETREWFRDLLRSAEAFPAKP